MTIDNFDEWVFCKDGAWYFWNETEDDYIGPYTDREEAVSELTRYAENLNNGDT
jgi:hypothetical protein